MAGHRSSEVSKKGKREVGNREMSLTKENYRNKTFYMEDQDGEKC